MGQPVLKRMVVVSMLINLRFSEMAAGPAAAGSRTRHSQTKCVYIYIYRERERDV